MSDNEFYSTCFKPLATWMRIIGIELVPLNFGTNYWSRFFSFFMFSITVSTNIGYTVTVFNNNYEAAAGEFWAMVIDYGSFMFLTIGGHGALLLLPQNSHWKLLCNNLRQMATENGKLFDSKSRKIVIASLLFILADGCITTIRAIFNAIQHDGSHLMARLLDAISLLSQIYGVSGLVLFATISWITTQRFVQFIALIRLNSPKSSADLTKLRRLFLSLSETVLHIGRCFGPLLFIWITFIFINVIASSFYLVNGVRKRLAQPTFVTFFIFSLTRNLVFLYVLASIPISLQRESLNVWKLLRRMTFDDPSLQDQLDSLTMEILQSPTEMTAMDLFNVNLTLFPTLVGTTLTYLIILSQFKSN